MDPEIYVRPVGSHMTNQLMAIGEEAFGSGYLDKKDIFNANTAAFSAMATPLDEDGEPIEGADPEPVGFVTCRIFSARSLASRHPAVADMLERDRIYLSDQAGMLKSIAVRPDFRLRGVGRRLARHAYNWMIKKDPEIVVMFGWKDDEGTQVEHIARRLGFRQRIEIPGFWSADSTERGYTCNTCGKPPCQCSAVVFSRP